MEGKYATVARRHPAIENPASNCPVPNSLRPVSNTESMSYLPQSRDHLPQALDLHMGPVGPWATGRVDWNPLSGLTGIRPVVDTYSIHRFSEKDWKFHNKELVDLTNKEQKRADVVDWNGRQCMVQCFDTVEKTQMDNTRRLNQRELEIHTFKCELDRAINAAKEEIYFLEQERRRLKEASKILLIPESISAECLERRTGRVDVELVRDDVEEEIIREAALCAEIRELFASTLNDIEKQLLENKSAKQRLEFDWADKKHAHEIDSINMRLSNSSSIILNKPGSVYFSEEQSTPDFWIHFTQATLSEAERTRQKSVALRGTLDAILVNAARDLRVQADEIEDALTKRIAAVQEILRRLETELKVILRQVVEVEELKESLKSALAKIETPMKVVQTRINSRLERPRVDNCRDNVQFGLVEEVKSIGESISALRAELKQAEHSEVRLIQIRNALEKEIIIKKKTLEIDIQRTRSIRLHFPSATALSGH
ncbi:tektin-4-like [Diabrotica virgifera virgifera]|uniref:Tektin n=1 Tax=Diabrotica virgifera virgifera TaxID=50390 RepID=A0A6P7GVU1_DIAVI|nr:tektin-4-like [Diabrotica virgifera virgifera]